MHVLVTYATRHGATQGIAEHIAATLEARSLAVTLRPVGEVDDVSTCDAFVIGGATYASHWLDEARTFVRENAATLRARPVWLFSSGPLGDAGATAASDSTCSDYEPKEFAEFERAIRPRGMRDFYGAYDPDAAPIGTMERVMHAFPPARRAMPAGDFRDWPAIGAWANSVADELLAVPVPA